MQTDPFILWEYIEKHTTEANTALQELYRDTNLHAMNPRMASGQVQGKFLELLCRMMSPKRVLEIGTFTGYSTICMAKGLPDDGIIVTIEANEECEDMIRKYIKKAEVEEKIKLIIGDAKSIITSLNECFDLVFIDADKISYPLYYELVFDKVKNGGFILADNVLWEGKVLNVNTKERDTQSIILFNKMVNEDQRVDNVLLPVRDGLMIIRKN
jgi:Predicted O-methyltransferase